MDPSWTICAPVNSCLIIEHVLHIFVGTLGIAYVRRNASVSSRPSRPGSDRARAAWAVTDRGCLHQPIVCHSLIMFIDLRQKHNLMEWGEEGRGGEERRGELGSKWREGRVVIVIGWMALETENWFFLVISSHSAYSCWGWEHWTPRMSPGKSSCLNDFTLWWSVLWRAPMWPIHLQFIMELCFAWAHTTSSPQRELIRGAWRLDYC